jgi:hypothetical protein
MAQRFPGVSWVKGTKPGTFAAVPDGTPPSPPDGKNGKPTRRERRRALTAEAARAAAEKGLGTLVATLPVQAAVIPVAFVFWFRDTRHLVHVFTDGLVYVPEPDVHPEGDPPVAMRFTQIEGVYRASTAHHWNGTYMWTSYSVSLHVTGRKNFIRLEGTFYDPAGHRGHWGDPRLPLFTRQLAALVAETRLPAARQAIAAGRALEFGKIMLTADGVRGTDGTVTSWAEVNGLNIAAGEVVVWGPAVKQRRSILVRERIANIPNFDLFTTLFNELCKAVS